MISKSRLKEIILSNEEFILTQIKKIVKRERIYLPENLDKVVVFYGVRRSGKTFILFDLFKKMSERSLYIDFEDERLVDFQIGDFERVKEVALELKPHLIGKGMVFLLDEIQNIRGWEKFCRRVVERENVKVCLSGSSSKIMPLEIHTELRGRSWGIQIFPFSFREYLGAKDTDISDKSFIYTAKKALIKNYFLDYLKWGGFPEVTFLESRFERKKLIKEYLDAMFFRDLVERYRITNITLLDFLTDKLFSSFATKFSLNSFYKQYQDKFPFSKDLLFRYYKYFLQSMLVFEVRKFTESIYKRMRNPAKVYLIDTGLCKRVTSADSGRLIENLVFLELKRRGYEVFYFEEKGECDFIVRNQEDKFLPMQVSFELTEENREREIKGLIDACKWLEINKGVILTYDEEAELNVGKIYIEILPIWKWLLANDRGQVLFGT